MDSHNSPTTKPLYRGIQIVWYIIGILESLLAIRFVLKLLAANSIAGFTSFIYAMTDIFVYPFVNVFRFTQVEGTIFEWTTLLAMVVYWFVAWAIINFLIMSKSVSTPEAAEKLDEQS